MESKINTSFLPIKINEEVIKEVYSDANRDRKKVLILVIATKPCFYKMWSIMAACRNKRVPFIILNTGQHFDDVLSHGIKEFNLNFQVGADFQIRGNLIQKSAEIFLKTKFFADYLKKEYPEIENWVYVNGDTISAAILSSAWLLSTNQKTIHGEAGLRGMSPEFFKKINDNTKFEDLVNKQFYGGWFVDRSEPFPEQWDTFVTGASSLYHLAPTTINKSNLIKESYSESKIFVTGNTVVDAINLKLNTKAERSVFDIYPQLEKGEWLRVDIHRRDNLSERRFDALIGGIRDIVKNGMNVIFVELTASRLALEHYGLRKKMMSLSEKNKNFVFTPLWKEYSSVIEFLKSKNCWAVYTDSGSMQEEMNELAKPCLTSRFNTDRPETTFDSKSNLLIPPFSREFVSKNILSVYKNEELRKVMSSGKKLYGVKVADKIITIIQKLWKDNSPLFLSSNEELGLWKENRRIDYL